MPASQLHFSLFNPASFLSLPQVIISKIFKKFLFYSYVHTMFGSFLPSSPTPSLTSSLSPSSPSIPSRNYFALISN
jgi:hypothetical protein